MLETNIIKDETSSYNQLSIVNRYEEYINYVYPILQNIPNKHSFFKEEVIRQLFQIVDLINDAAKTNQISRLYLVDSALASMRFKLRFMVFEKRKMITKHQHQVCLKHISEVGAILGSWIKKFKKG